MKRSSNLSKNLKAIQDARQITQAEFAQALDMPKSTLYAVMVDGNTTLETLIHLANALDVTLDELVFDTELPEKCSVVRWIMRGVGWYKDQPKEKREMLCGYMREIVHLLENK